MDVLVNDLRFEPFLSEDMIQKRVKEIAEELKQQFESETPIFLCMLSGAFIFMADLVRVYEAPCEISFVKYHSYEGMESTGELSEVMGIQEKLEGRSIIFVEDIIDSGNTLEQFLPILRAQNPKSISIVSLLVKPEALEFDHHIDIVGFEIENLFVLGYGLDYNGVGRQLRGIYKLKKIGG